MDTPHGS